MKERRSRRRRSVPPLTLLLMGGGLLLLIVAGVMTFGGQANAESGITLLDGSTVTLDDYKGQTVLVNFWASWCPPCRAEMPLLDAYYEQHRDEGFVMIAVNSREPASTARSFIEQTGFGFPVGLDEDGRLTREFGVNGLPVTIVYGPDGEVAYRHGGLITADVLEAEVTPLLR